jgi:hypothetical protein
MNNIDAQTLINSYFKDLILTLVETREQYCIYAAHISSMLSSEKMYLLVFVRISNARGDKISIGHLDWDNIQTRKLKEGYKTGSHQRWVPPRGYPDPECILVERRPDRSIFQCNMLPNLQIELMHDPRKKTAQSSGMYQYNRKMNLLSCLNTFSSSCSLIQ